MPSRVYCRSASQQQATVQSKPHNDRTLKPACTIYILFSPQTVAEPPNKCLMNKTGLWKYLIYILLILRKVCQTLLVMALCSVYGKKVGNMRCYTQF